MAIKVNNVTVISDTRNFIPASIEANNTVGIAGSILSSTGEGLSWISPPSGFSVTDDTTTNSTYYPVFVNSTTGTPSQTSVSSTKLSFNPSTGIVSSSQFNDTKGEIRSIPLNSQSALYTLQIVDAGRCINVTAGTGVSVPTGTFTSGQVVTVFNNTATSKSLTVGTGGTIRLGGTTLTGTRTIASYGIITILCASNNLFVVSGAGLS